MDSVAFLSSCAASSLFGTGVGFCTGLVPGLHVNNVAAVIVAGSASTLAAFSALGGLTGCGHAPLLVACFLVSAMVSHMFSEAVVATYLGIPSGDTVSLLPAHRLARAGLGRGAVASSADGSLAGVVIGLAFLAPVCAALGSPLGLYSPMKAAMGVIVAVLSAMLVGSEGLSGGVVRPRRLCLALAVFLWSGALGTLVLDTEYFASSVPEFPWFDKGFVRVSSLLLPLFAGLFGIPTLILSMDSTQVSEAGVHAAEGRRVVAGLRRRDVLMSVLGGTLVGWIPGMTSGSSATLCATVTKHASPEGGSTGDAARFIWLYSAISSCGAILSVGALFMISRARSGIMQAVSLFLGEDGIPADDLGSFAPVGALLLAMSLSALVSHIAIRSLSEGVLDRLQRILCSRGAALASMVFVTSLVLALTGVRGGLLFASASTLGLVPPLCGVRRINLMGCLLVPICATFLLG